MKIGRHDTDSRVVIIAEIGNNHEGSVARAEEMIGRAAEAGADAVKFQTIIPEFLVSPNDLARVKQLGRLCLEYDDFVRLKEVATQVGVEFLSTPFDLESVQFLESLVPAYKIASGDNNFFPLIEAVAKTEKPTIMSTGLADRDAIIEAKIFIEAVWRDRGVNPGLALLHCVSSYPTPAEAANLSAINALAELGVTVGYSDHTLGVSAAILSVARGARIIEKHFTLDKNFSDFRDHSLSADFDDMAKLVLGVREAELLLGGGGLVPGESEASDAVKIRRSIVAARNLQAGEVLVAEDLTWIRPGDGIAPGNEGRLIGRKLARAVERGDAIHFSHLTKTESE